MASGVSPSEQVGLFSTQISEQIFRLRALARGREGVSGPDQVALKRAVMATRLLAGSARILQFADIQQFLDRLLDWMKSIEVGAQALTSTEQLILESVIDVEERLMDVLDRGDVGDIPSFREEFEDLRNLMERHDDKRREQNELRRERAEFTAKGKSKQSASDLLERLGQLVKHLEELDELRDDPSLSDLTLEQLSELNQRLGGAIKRWSGELRRNAAAAAHAVNAVQDWPRGDDLLDPLWQQLQESSERIGLPIRFNVEGDTELLGSGLRDLIGEILRHLLDDCCSSFGQTKAEDSEFLQAEILLSIELVRGRLEVRLRDNAPTVEQHSFISGADSLSFYPGLRRSRLLIQQLNGIIQVEPSEMRGVRFMLQLPSDLMAQTYQLLRFAGQDIAVPWVRVVHELQSKGLVYEADASGESFVRNGRNIPLAELSQYCAALEPRSSLAPQILVVGSVERRLGVFADEIGELVESSSLSDPPAEWNQIAYGSLEYDGAQIPILDVVRLVELRHEAQSGGEPVGGAHDSGLDSYVPAETEKPRSRSDARRLNVMLVNRSEFRRREIARVLQRLGHELSFASDLLAARKREEHPTVDLIITDLRLGQEGLEDLSGIREAYGSVPIVLTSSASRTAGEELASRVGADHCWLDPFDAADLNRILDELG